MGKRKSRRDLLYLKPRWFYKYVTEHFNVLRYTGSKIVPVKPLKEIISDMNGLRCDLAGLESWYLREKNIPYQRFYLRVNENPYYTYHFIIFQNRFTGKFFTLDSIKGFHQYECQFQGVLLEFLLRKFVKYHRIKNGYTYELYRYNILPSGFHEPEKICVYIKHTGTPVAISETDFSLLDQVVESKFFE